MNEIDYNKGLKDAVREVMALIGHGLDKETASILIKNILARIKGK